MLHVLARLIAAAFWVLQFGPDPYEGLDELPVPGVPPAKCVTLLIHDMPSAVSGGVTRIVGNTAVARFLQTRGFDDGSQTLLLVQLDQQSPVSFPIQPQKQLVMYFSNLSPGQHRLLNYTLKRDSAENITTYLVQSDCFVVKK
jgi:hypothetical protein